MRKHLQLLLLALTLAVGSAHASFHLWSMSELYSNADGSVQFLELRALAGGQQFLGGHSLSSTSGGVTHTFDFPTGLPGDTAGHTMVIGTQGFASLGVVTPDYIVPDGFFFKAGGSVNFAGADSWTHGALPDGTLSLNRDGSTATNSPKNFAGQTGSVPATTPAPTPFNLHGLWWNDPDNSEAGWGINLSHHGNIVFLSWFTYDTAGTSMWLFMSNAVRTGTNTYTGEIFRSTGAPFDAYDASRFSGPSVGSGTLVFTDAGHGQFTYTVNNFTQAKQIKRYIFGSLPTCDQSGGAATNFTDLWGNAGEAGWGVNVVQQDNIVFASWFTYGSDARGIWLFGSSLTRTSGNTFSGDLYRSMSGPAFNTTNWGATPVVAPKVGTATLSFTGTSTGTFTYTVGTLTQTKNIARNVHSLPATTCR